MAALTPPEMRGINTVILRDGREIHLDDITTAAEGQGFLDDLDTAILGIQDDLDEVRSTHCRPDWHGRATVALRRKRRIRDRLQHRIAELRKAERRAEVQAAAAAVPADVQRKAFVLAAAELLDHEVVTELWVRARELRPAAFAEGGAA